MLLVGIKDAVVHFTTIPYTAHKVQEKPYFSSICPRANARDDNLLPVVNDIANASLKELFRRFFSHCESFSVLRIIPTEDLTGKLRLATIVDKTC